MGVFAKKTSPLLLARWFQIRLFSSSGGGKGGGRQELWGIFVDTFSCGSVRERAGSRAHLAGEGASAGFQKKKNARGGVRRMVSMGTTSTSDGAFCQARASFSCLNFPFLPPLFPSKALSSLGFSIPPPPFFLLMQALNFKLFSALLLVLTGQSVIVLWNLVAGRVSCESRPSAIVRTKL